MERIGPNPAVLSPTRPRADLGERFINSKAERRVSDYRLTLGWLMLGLWVGSTFGLNWDIQWHGVVGRDGFWTPPHWMFYSTVTAAGLICLGVVLVETLLYYRRYPGLHDGNTTRVLGFFRGPLGFILAGFGMLVMLSSAPLDDYWHQIFGIDLAVWTPFHVMLLLGIIMGNLGMVYLFASEMNRRRAWQTPLPPETSRGWRILAGLRDLFRPAQLGLTLAFVSLTMVYFGAFQPTSLGGSLSFGSWVMPSYSLVVTGAAAVLVAAVWTTGRVGTATLVGLLFGLLHLAVNWFINWGIQTLAVDQGVTLRSYSSLIFTDLLYPASLVGAGLLVDLIYLLTMRWRAKGRTGPMLAAAGGAGLAAGLLLFWLERPWQMLNDFLLKQFGILVSTKLWRPDQLAALPIVLPLAIMAGLVGLAWATSLRYTDR